MTFLVSKSRSVALAVSAAFILAGCTPQDDVDATRVTIVTTESSLDHAAALAVAEYVAQQDIEVSVEQHTAPEEVFLAVHEAAEPSSDHARIGVVTAHQDPASDETPLRIPESVEIFNQAPAELALVPVTSTVTAAGFAAQDDAEEPRAELCQDQVWLHAPTPEQEMEEISVALADVGCQPDFETVVLGDSEEYLGLAQRLTVEHDTVALLHEVDPMITDQGLTTLEVATGRLPSSRVVAVGAPALEDPLTDHVGTVLDVLDSGAATSLLRGYHNAQTSTSDLAYETDHAIRYWLATHGLADSDTVIDISTDNR